MIKLRRDVSSGLVLQEIIFWLSLEWASGGIEAEFRTAEVGIAMDALRNAKRGSMPLLVLLLTRVEGCYGSR